MSSSKQERPLSTNRNDRERLPLPLKTSSITCCPDSFTHRARSRRGRRQLYRGCAWRCPECGEGACLAVLESVLPRCTASRPDLKPTDLALLSRLG
eukprot:5091947-Pyramimonas_sp.AAC.1